MIFLSYRKADAQPVVDYLADRLKRDFGADAVFKDDRDLHAGERWPDRLRSELLARRILVAVVGERWLTALDDDGRRRLDDPDDWVRLEICTALEQGKNVLVLLVGAARMPSKRGLPADCPLQQLPDLLSLPYRTGADSEGDYARLVDALRHLLEPARPTSGPAAKPLPRQPSVCFGREAQLAELLAVLLPTPSGAKVPATPVGGISGIGKSTCVLTALHDPRVAERYGDRRHFVRLDGATSRSGVAAAVAESVGLPLGEALEARLLDLLGRDGPRLLVLDNAETPLLADDRTETEDLLRDWTTVPTLALVATLRGTRPLGAGWRRPLELRRLDETATRATFLAGTGGQFADDPDLDKLLAELDGWPLAVTLLAYQAGNYADLKELTEAWRRKRAALLTKGVKKREADIGASIEMSLFCPLQTADGRRLLSLLGLLPDGIRHGDLAELLPPDGIEAAAEVRRVGGLTFDDGPRLRVLAPVREYLAAHLPPQDNDRDRALAFYSRLAEVEGNKMGRTGGREAALRLGPETGNCTVMIRLGLRSADPDLACWAAIGLSQFARYGGSDTSVILQEAERVAQERRNSRCHAECCYGFGKIAQDRGDQAGAERYYQQARTIYHQLKDELGEANCVRRLGDLELIRAEYPAALRHYESALPMYVRAGDIRGEAKCIRKLGDIALRLGDQVEARRGYEQALLRFQKIGDDCGQADCLHRLGDIARKRMDYAEGRRCYQAALPLFQQVASIRGEAGSVRGLGKIARDEGRRADAREFFFQALTLSQRIRDSFWIGRTHYLLILVTEDTERQAHIAAAREVYSRILRLDLVAQLDQEFGPLIDPSLL